MDTLPTSDPGQAATSAAVPASSLGMEDPTPVSKREKKRIEKRRAKAEWHSARKEDDKKRRKEDSERLRQEREERKAQMSPEEREEMKRRKTEALAERQRVERDKRSRMDQAMASGQNIVIDLDFQSLMTGGERTSLAQQVMFSYAENLKSTAPCRLSLTSLEGLALEHFQKFSGFENWRLCRYSESYLEAFADSKSNLVYLTADATTVIDELEHDKIYIIGGIVDRNRHKHVTLKKATEQHIATARLPIAEHVKVNSSQVLTVNQVMAILLRYLETKDWRKALEQMVPQRKRAADDKKATANSGKNEQLSTDHDLESGSVVEVEDRFKNVEDTDVLEVERPQKLGHEILDSSTISNKSENPKTENGKDIGNDGLLVSLASTVPLAQNSAISSNGADKLKETGVTNGE